jgi:cell division protein FtsL
MITLVFGLIYVAEGTKATGYDYEISSVNSEIDEMIAKKEDLAVEKARLTSVEAIRNSAVAMSMEDATVTGYAAE